MSQSWAPRTWIYVLALMLLPSVSSAQSLAGNKAAAEALFEEGRTLMQQGKYQEACGKLQASQDQDAGLGTLMLLSDCFEKTGRSASAWATFKEAAAVARAQGDAAREEVARARAEALEPKLAKLVVRGAESTMQLPGLEVRMNGQLVPQGQWGTSIPVDPGEVSFVVTAPGYKSWNLVAQVVEGPSETSIDVPELEPEATAAPAATSGETQVTTADTQQSPTPTDRGAGDSTMTTLGLALGIGGVVAVGVGSYFGLRAKSKNDDSKDFCNDDNECFPEGLDLRDDAQQAANVSTLLFGVGGALLVAGGVLYFTNVDSGSATLKEVRWYSGVAPGGARMGLEGRW